jgi:hypothetical protein
MTNAKKHHCPSIAGRHELTPTGNDECKSIIARRLLDGSK